MQTRSGSSLSKTASSKALSGTTAKKRVTGGWMPRVAGGSREGRRRVAAVLDVLAGVSTPAEAASALSVSLPRYYVFEGKLLEAMVEACEPGADGRRRNPEKELDVLRREVERLKRECARKQALVRVVQRTVGLTFAAPTSKTTGKRRRRPSVRALKVASVLRTQEPETSVVEVNKELGRNG